MLKFSNTYISLGGKFYQRSLPEGGLSPKLLLWNESVAASLKVPKLLSENEALLAQYFSGNQELNGAEPIALAYSGHQFGHFNPQLGDGRAHLLGEVVDVDNVRRDIQLKGSGRTKFSRQGDGRCALAPAIREYIMSEAMYSLGVPTSRCLAVVGTGETIYRGAAKDGAVVTRVAASHIRVGSFQYFAARGDINSLKKLTEYAITRHFPDINTDIISDITSDISAEDNFEQRTLQFLARVIANQVTLIVAWLRVGFIHGVMNTDNTAISGETIDFGPCAMMGSYHEKAAFSSIDTYKRYAFGNQAKIAQWNMARLADCLLPLVNSDEDKALAQVEPIIRKFSVDFDQAYFTMFSNKLGFELDHSDDENIGNSTINRISSNANEDLAVRPNKVLINDLLAIMQKEGLDYTQTFLLLTQSLDDEEIAQSLKNTLGTWYKQWRLCLENALEKSNEHLNSAKVLMMKNNPVVIPRNHHVETILARCESKSGVDTEVVNEFLKVLRSPYQEIAETKKYQDTDVDGEQYYQTFCGT